MKKLILHFLFITLFSTNINSQIKVQITVTSNAIDNDNGIFITGNKPELGNWDPGEISLAMINDSTWSKEFYFQKDDVIEFKLTKGSWDKEALNPDGSVPGNYIINVLRDTSIYLNIKNWKDSTDIIAGQITGQVKYYSNFTGKKVLPRDIIIWLPPSYDSLANKYYPVLYMQDGQNIFDPSTSAFGVDWQVDETADSLIKAGAINEIIIVGIYNTNFRSSEYSENDTGYTYLNFIKEELKPFIDSSYRTLPDKINTAIGGSSLGGLISFMMLWENSDVFSKAACLSPAFRISNIDYVKTVKSYSGVKKNIKIYIDNGGIGLEQKLQPGVDEMLTALKSKGYEERKEILYYQDENAEHNEKAWSKRVWRFLEFFFSK
ncbi:MAG: alpha/beta hydrolase-fold protein [Ignavibacteriaceae bacterium]